MKKNIVNVLIIIASFLICQNCTDNQNENLLKWPKVKTEYKPGTYWWWMGSAVDKENLKYNLDEFNNVGIGSVHIIPIYGVQGEEEKYIDFLSPKWINMVEYTVDVAEEYNMNVDMSTTTGWPFGGSHINSDNAAKKIIYEVIELNENEKISKKIDKSNIEAVIAYSTNNKQIDLLKKISNQNMLNWQAPEGKWKIYILTKKGTGQNVKRAAPGNEGLVLDPFSKEALGFYLERYDKAFLKKKGMKLRGQYHDSYEYYHANWTDNFFEKFEKYNNYDLKEHIPSLLDTNKSSNYVKADYRRTLANMHLDYITSWTKWSNQNGWITRNEGHGAPANLLDLYSASDIPETETFGARKFDIPGLRYNKENISESAPPNLLILKFASSAAHVSGKQLVASETCTWLREHFKTSLAQVKLGIDELFISGINHIFYHGNAYSPKDAEWPGWKFYASTHFEKENAFWKNISELNNYITRCQSFLQSGKPSNDILLYWPIEDIYHSFQNKLIKTLNVHDIGWFLNSKFGKLAKKLDDQGYSFDYISDNQIKELNTFNSQIESNGNNYKTIVIPQTNYMPIGTLQKLKELTKSGVKIIFENSFPKDTPGYLHHYKSKLELEEIVSQMTSLENEDENIIKSSLVNSSLEKVGVKAEQMVKHGLKYIRRKHNKGYSYFLTNLTAKTINDWVMIATDPMSIIIFDPRYENKIGFAKTRQNNGHTEVYLQLQPGESCILKTYTHKMINGLNWDYYEKNNEEINIQGEWNIEFIEGGPVKPSFYSTDSLKSWTDNGDSLTERFAGTARYSILFDLEKNSSTNYILDLGKVCESASIYINDEYAGSLWSFPFNLSVGDFLKNGKNKLNIDVTNLSSNRIRSLDIKESDWKKYFFVNIHYKKFNAASWDLMESGLMGPVKLFPINSMSFK